MSTVSIISKGRKYFKIKLNNKYDAKLLIDEKSSAFEEGQELDLDLNDISVRSKYGTDLIFSVKQTEEEKKSIGICTLRTERYNRFLTEECRRLGGTWNAEEKAWIFSKMVEQEVEELDFIFNSDEIVIEATCVSEKFGCGSEGGKLMFFGYEIARAFGRDSGAKTSTDVALISGKITSGGSIKNWGCVIKNGAVIRFSIPRGVFEKYRDDESKFEFKIL